MPGVKNSFAIDERKCKPVTIDMWMVLIFSVCKNCGMGRKFQSKSENTVKRHKEEEAWCVRIMHTLCEPMKRLY